MTRAVRAETALAAERVRYPLRPVSGAALGCALSARSYN